MLRDASHQQVIQKFSFIKSLNSRKSNRNSQSNPSKLNIDEAFSFQHQKTSTADLAVKTENKANKASAIVATSDTTTTSSISADWYQANPANYELSLAEIIGATSVDSSGGTLATDWLRNALARNSTKRNYLGKVLFALASSYGLFVLWWLFGHQGNRVFSMLRGDQQVVLSKSDVQFIDYMERSLEQIDRQLEAKRAASGKDDIVYVPVYTPTPATPQVPLASSFNSPTPAIPPSQAAPEPLKIPAPPPLPAPTPIEKTEDSPPQNQVATVSEPVPHIPHTLTGILELGEGKSAALVKVQGQTRRVWLGEEINTDGWILESVGDQRAKISYQGQDRFIAVGETF
jgi:hypothetical protein